MYGTFQGESKTVVSASFFNQHLETLCFYLPFCSLQVTSTKTPWHETSSLELRETGGSNVASIRKLDFFSTIHVYFYLVNANTGGG